MAYMSGMFCPGILYVWFLFSNLLIGWLFATISICLLFVIPFFINLDPDKSANHITAGVLFQIIRAQRATGRMLYPYYKEASGPSHKSRDGPKLLQIVSLFAEPRMREN